MLVEQAGIFDLPLTESLELEMSSSSDKGCTLELFPLIFLFPLATVDVCRRPAVYQLPRILLSRPCHESLFLLIPYDTPSLVFFTQLLRLDHVFADARSRSSIKNFALPFPRPFSHLGTSIY